MYMTRVMLKRPEPPNIIHGVLSVALPGNRGDETSKNLWRVDTMGENKELLVVSFSSPKLHHIVKEIGAEDERNKTLPYSPFLGRLENGQVWNFRLCANPVAHHKNSASTRGKIHALRSVDEQLNWLNKQGLKHGFSVKGCTVTGDEWRIFNTSKNNEKNTVRIRAITFEGLLSIADAEIFRTALSRGIGRGKAYGCALLTIARVQV